LEELLLQTARPDSDYDKRYVKKFASEVERDFLLDLLVVNLTGKDMMGAR
jgi:hypothetical protein